MFSDIKVNVGNGKFFHIIAKNCSDENKYIQSATLNGKPLNRPWITHEEVKNGATLVLNMGDRPNKEWGAAVGNEPPSAQKL